METKQFKSTTVAGLYSGVMLAGTFSDIHECAEWVAGHPIWTHEFADKAKWDALKAALVKAFPEIVECDELVAGCNRENYSEKAAAVEKRWPDPIELPKGSEQRTESPLESLSRIAPNKPVIIADVD